MRESLTIFFPSSLKTLLASGLSRARQLLFPFDEKLPECVCVSHKLFRNELVWCAPHEKAMSEAKHVNKKKGEKWELGISLRFSLLFGSTRGELSSSTIIYTWTHKFRQWEISVTSKSQSLLRMSENWYLSRLMSTTARANYFHRTQPTFYLMKLLATQSVTEKLIIFLLTRLGFLLSSSSQGIFSGKASSACVVFEWTLPSEICDDTGPV